jgi:hypothetical protein
VTFRIIDLDRPRLDLGAYRGLRDSIRWSFDGSRVSWCRSRHQAWELVLGTPPRRLEACPLGYTVSGALAFVRGRGIFARGRRVVLAPGPIASASFGVDGSLALLVGRRILRYGSVGDPNPIAAVTLTREFRGEPIFAFDNCSALLRSRPTGAPPTIEVVALACARPVEPTILQGNEVAWSPDSRWIAVSDDPGIAIYSFDGARATIRIEEQANQLLWQVP